MKVKLNLQKPNQEDYQLSSHPPWLMLHQMKRTAVSSVRNQNILHDIALTLGAMNPMNVVTMSWTVHTQYHLQELQ